MTFSIALSSVKTVRFLLFAGLCACLSAGPFSASAQSVDLSLIDPLASYSRTASGFSPSHLFATEAGLYVLDTTKLAICVYARGNNGAEIQSSTRFTGYDAERNGQIWSRPVAVAKCPDANLIAVLDACNSVPSFGMNPAVHFYRFEETLNESGMLEAVTFTYVGRAASANFSAALDVAFYDETKALVVWASTNSTSVNNTSSFSTVDLSGDSGEFAVSETSAVCELVGNVNGIDIDPATRTVYGAMPSRHVLVKFADVEAAIAASTADAPATVAAAQVYGTLDESGTDANHLSNPRDVAVWYPSIEGATAQAVLVTADIANGRLSFFVADSTEAATYGSRGSTGNDVFLNPDRASVLGSDTVVVSDTGNRRLRVYSAGDLLALAPALNFTFTDTSVTYILPDGTVTLPWEVSRESNGRTFSVRVVDADTGAETTQPVTLSYNEQSGTAFEDLAVVTTGSFTLTAGSEAPETAANLKVVVEGFSNSPVEYPLVFQATVPVTELPVAQMTGVWQDALRFAVSNFVSGFTIQLQVADTYNGDAALGTWSDVAQWTYEEISGSLSSEVPGTPTTDGTNAFWLEGTSLTGYIHLLQYPEYSTWNQKTDGGLFFRVRISDAAN